MIKKNASELVKEFHKDHSLWSVLTEWIKNKNKQLLLNTQNIKNIVVWEQQENTAQSIQSFIVQEQQEDTAWIMIWNTQTQRIWLCYMIQ